jgi:hypothetical protein
MRIIKTNVYENPSFGNQTVPCGGEKTDRQTRRIYCPHKMR